MTVKATRMTASERREQILDVTKSLVDEKGFHAVSIEAVARRAGITRPVVYTHFTDLPGLLEALVDREGARAIQQLAQLLPSALPGTNRRDTLLHAMRSYLDAVAADPITWRLVLMPPEGAPELLRTEIERGRELIVAQLAEVARPGLVPGRASPDPELTGWMLSSLSDSAARLLLTDPERWPVSRLMTHTEWLLDQLAA
jgi:AcrR family transcriptional regulator